MRILAMLALLAACGSGDGGTGGADGNGGGGGTKQYSGSFSLVPQTKPPYSEASAMAQLVLGDASCGAYSASIQLSGGTGPSVACGTLDGATVTFTTLGAIVVNQTYRVGFATADLGTANELQLTFTGIDPESFTASFHGTAVP
jgi:hypothetical protein